MLYLALLAGLVIFLQHRQIADLRRDNLKLMEAVAHKAGIEVSLAPPEKLPRAGWTPESGVRVPEPAWQMRGDDAETR